jgi:hypothetical protein
VCEVVAVLSFSLKSRRCNVDRWQVDGLGRTLFQHTGSIMGFGAEEEMDLDLDDGD